MRLPPIHPDPHALPPLRHGPPRPAERLTLPPRPKRRPLDGLAAVLAALYVVLAFTLIFLGTHQGAGCAAIGHVLALGCREAR